MSRPLLMPAAATLTACTLLAVCVMFALVGWDTAAVLVAVVGIPVAGLSLASGCWVFALGWKALVEARRQLGELEAQRSGGVQEDGDTR